MAKIYKRNIDSGKITIENVPEKWRAEVEKLIGKDGGT